MWEILLKDTTTITLSLLILTSNIINSVNFEIRDNDFSALLLSKNIK